MRTAVWFLLSAAVASGQTLPSYLSSTYPAPGATNVPTNVNIVLQGPVELEAVPFASAGYYTLETATGGQVSFANNYNCTCLGNVLIPIAPLAANTLYTFTVNPGASVGPAYSFQFTTGSGSDVTPPQLLSVSPPSGSANQGLEGPFNFQFSKRITREVTSEQGVTVITTPSSIYGSNTGLSVSADGTTLIVTVNPLSGYPTSYTITVDPAKFVDAAGNAGTGAPVTAYYTTFVATDTSGPHLQASLPASGATGVPTNVMPRLIFQKDIDFTTLSKGIQLQSGGVTQKISFNSTLDLSGGDTGGAFNIVPASLLAPNQAYTIVINSGLLDPSGFPVQQTIQIPFTTGAGPDAVMPTVLGASPAAYGIVPPNVQVVIRTNKPIASMVPARLAAVGLIFGQIDSEYVPVTATLSPDGTLLTMVPQSPLAAGAYSINTSEVVDGTGSGFSFSSNGVGFTVSGNADTTPFAILAMNPPTGATGVPLTTAIEGLFNKPCANCTFPGVVTVSSASGLQSPIVYSSTNGFYLAGLALAPSTQYTVSLSGVMDLVGNALPNSSFTFTTASVSTTPPTLNLLSSTPANGATGVNPAGPFAFTYDGPLNPVAAASSATLLDSTNFSYAVTAAASGSTLTVTPVAALPANTVFRLSLYLSSALGAGNNSGISFTTAASSDTTRPRVTAITPASGTVLPWGSNTLTLTFSKPISPVTITQASLSLLREGYDIGIPFVRSADELSVSFTLSNLSASPFSIIASAAITDLAGNPLEPLVANYQQMTVTDVTGNSFIHEMRPAKGSTGVPANTTITWFLDQPVTLAAVQADLVILANDAPFAGSFSLAGNGRILVFTPAQPFPANASVSFYERSTPPLLGLSQYPPIGFTIAATPATGLHIVGTSIGDSAALNAVFEIEFNQTPPSKGILVTLIYQKSYNFSFSYQTNVRVVQTVPRPNVLRLTPEVHREPGTYNFDVILPGATSGNNYSSTLTSTPLAGTPTVEAVGPPNGSTGVPLNASARILFGAAINPVSVTAQSASLSVNGAPLTVTTQFAANDREIILTPNQALPPNTNVSVTLSGLEDVSGRPIPNSSFSFTTGADADYVAPSVLYTSLPYFSSNVPQIGPREAVQMVFSKAIDPAIAALESSSTVTATISSDLRVLTVTPNGAWPAGQQNSLIVNSFSDLSGNAGAIPGQVGLDFQVAFQSSQTRPQPVALTPPNGSSGMPLNARVIVSFTEPVSTSAGGVTLTDSAGNSVPLTLLYGNDPSILIYAPTQSLQPDAAYTIAVSGITDLSGNLMPGSVSSTFLTGENVDTTGTAGTLLVESPLPTNWPIRIRYSEPISPASLTPQDIELFSQNVNSVKTLVPSAFSVASDDLSITITPQSPLVPGQTYVLELYAPTDLAGIGGLGLVSDTFVAGSAPDTTLPTVSIYPPDGTIGFPTSALTSLTFPGISAVFSKPADLLSSPPTIQVSTNGTPVAGATTTTSTSIAFTPSAALAFNTTYQVQVAGVVDYLGNAAPPVSARFTTAVSSTAQYGDFGVASFQPSNGSVGVANNTPIVVAFNQVLAGLPNGAVGIQSSSSLPPAGQWSLANADTVQFTPSSPWPSAATITVTVSQYGSYPLDGYFTDAAGIHLDNNYTFSFTTAVNPNNTPLTLVSVSPAAGATIQPGSNTFTLTFSKPVVVGSQAIQALNGNQFESVNTSYGPSDSVILVTAYYATAGSSLTLAGSSGITDGYGNTLAPFSYQYPVATPATGPPTVSSASPTNYATNVAATTPIQLQFSRPMDPTTLLAGLEVTQNGALFAGQWQFLNSNQTAQFTPAVAYKAGATIYVFVLATAADATGIPFGQQYQYFFTVAGTSVTPPPGPPVRVSLTGFRDAVDPAAALDLAFDRDLDPSTIAANIWLRAGETPISGTAVPLGASAIRFQPAEPLAIGQQYILTVGPNLRSTAGLAAEPREFAFRADPTGDPVTVESAAYAANPAPLAIRLRFSGPMNPVSAAGLTVLAADGSPIAVSPRFSTDGCEWLLPLPRIAPVTVRVEGIEDAHGRPLPAQTVAVH